mgnify:CR=1 FL=1
MTVLTVGDIIGVLIFGHLIIINGRLYEIKELLKELVEKEREQNKK